MTAGVTVNNDGLFAYTTFTWLKSAAPADLSVWTSAVIARETGPAAPNLQVTVTCPFQGTVNLLYGTRPSDYFGKVGPIGVAPAVATVIRLPDLKSGTTYYVLPIWAGVVPATPPNPNRPGQFQFGELSASTP